MDIVPRVAQCLQTVNSITHFQSKPLLALITVCNCVWCCGLCLCTCVWKRESVCALMYARKREREKSEGVMHEVEDRCERKRKNKRSVQEINALSTNKFNWRQLHQEILSNPNTKKRKWNCSFRKNLIQSKTWTTLCQYFWGLITSRKTELGKRSHGLVVRGVAWRARGAPRLNHSSFQKFFTFQ